MNIEECKNLLGWASLNKLYIDTHSECDYHNIYTAIETLLTAYEKEKEKNKELSDKLTEKICKGVEEEILEEYRQTIISKDKEIEELKENNKLLQENYSSAHEDINWFCENYISKEVSEQKERKAYIKGTNDADELCNNKWKNKIKAKIEEVKDGTFDAKIVLQSLLEKE